MLWISAHVSPSSEAKWGLETQCDTLVFVSLRGKHSVTEVMTEDIHSEQQSPFSMVIRRDSHWFEIMHPQVD